MQQLLLVDDDGLLASSVMRGLASEWSVVHCATPKQALQWLRVQRPDLIILDVELQAQLDGFALCRILRKGGWAGDFTYRPPDVPIPILMLTSRHSVDDKVHGLDEGADDYLPKPFDIRELRARSDALLRRYSDRSPYFPDAAVIRIGSLTIYPSPERRVVNGLTTIDLTDTEYDLLYWLAANPNVWHSREALLQGVWHVQGQVDTRTVDAFVRRLRQKLAGVSETPLIQTKYGAGYRIVR